MLTPILQMGKLRLQEVKGHVQTLISTKRGRQDLNPPVWRQHLSPYQLFCLLNLSHRELLSFSWVHGHHGEQEAVLWDHTAGRPHTDWANE